LRIDGCKIACLLRTFTLTFTVGADPWVESAVPVVGAVFASATKPSTIDIILAASALDNLPSETAFWMSCLSTSPIASVEAALPNPRVSNNVLISSASVFRSEEDAELSK
jgi:hypothetical protein